MYYYTQYRYISQDLREILDDDLLKRVEITEIPVLYLVGSDGVDYASYGYSDSIIEACQYEMKDGIWFDEYQGQYIPAISTDSEIKTGEIIDIGSHDIHYKVEIIGYLETSSYIINFHGGSSNNYGSLENFVSHPDCQLIVPYESQKLLSVKDNVIAHKELSCQRMIFIKDKESAEQFLSVCHEYGAVSSVETMKENYDNDIKNDFLVNGMILLVFSVLSITGLIGYNGIQYALHEKDYLIYYLLGGKNHDFVVMEVIKNIIILAISYGTFIFLYKKMDVFVYSTNELNVITFETIVCVFAFLSLICIGTSLWYIRKMAKKQWIDSYKLKV